MVEGEGEGAAAAAVVGRGTALAVGGVLFFILIVGAEFE